MIILGILFLAAAFIVAGAVTGASSSWEEKPPVFKHPELMFFNHFEAADYLAISVEELNMMVEKELLDGVFVAITSMTETGEEPYYDYDENGKEIVLSRPVIEPVTRYVFSRKKLDERMLEIFAKGNHLDFTLEDDLDDSEESNEEQDVLAMLV
jgi:hypothetical protein